MKEKGWRKRGEGEEEKEPDIYNKNIIKLTNKIN
jgi:hypothetical protein